MSFTASHIDNFTMTSCFIYSRLLNTYKDHLRVPNTSTRTVCFTNTAHNMVIVLIVNLVAFSSSALFALIRERSH